MSTLLMLLFIILGIVAGAVLVALALFILGAWVLSLTWKQESERD